MRITKSLPNLSYSALEELYEEKKWMGMSNTTLEWIYQLFQPRQRIYTSRLPYHRLQFNSSYLVSIPNTPDMVVVFADSYEELTEDPFVSWAKEVRRNAGVAE